MPSDEEFRELKDQVASLSSALATARRRIDDLEDGMADHLGLDWGESLVDVNSPHPNISANTIETGGGIIRQDANGMQIEGASLTSPIYFVEQLSADPSELTAKGVIAGYADSTTPEAGVEILAYSSSASSAAASLSVTSDVNSWIVGSTGAAGFSLNVGTGGASPAGKFNLSFGATLLQLALFNADPSNTSIADGNMWYRADTDKFRGRVNGATTNFLMESGTVSFAADISPAQITGNQDDYSPTGVSGASVLRLSTDASRDITGITGGDDGRVLFIFNIGGFNIVLKNDVTSTAANRFLFPADITLAPNEGIGLMYDSTSSRWRCFGRY